MTNSCFIINRTCRLDIEKPVALRNITKSWPLFDQWCGQATSPQLSSCFEWGGRRSRSITIFIQCRSIHWRKTHHNCPRRWIDCFNSNRKHSLCGCRGSLHDSPFCLRNYDYTDMPAFIVFQADCCARRSRVEGKHHSHQLWYIRFDCFVITKIFSWYFPDMHFAGFSQFSLGLVWRAQQAGIASGRLPQSHHINISSPINLCWGSDRWLVWFISGMSPLERSKEATSIRWWSWISRQQ